MPCHAKLRIDWGAKQFSLIGLWMDLIIILWWILKCHSICRHCSLPFLLCVLLRRKLCTSIYYSFYTRFYAPPEWFSQIKWDCMKSINAASNKEWVQTQMMWMQFWLLCFKNIKLNEFAVFYASLCGEQCYRTMSMHRSAIPKCTMILSIWIIYIESCKKKSPANSAYTQYNIRSHFMNENHKKTTNSEHIMHSDKMQAFIF